MAWHQGIFHFIAKCPWPFPDSWSCGRPPGPLFTQPPLRLCVRGAALCMEPQGAQAPHMSSKHITDLSQELALVSTRPWKSPSEKLPLTPPCPTVHCHLIQRLGSKVSAFRGGCLQPAFLLDVPWAGTEAEPLFSVGTAHLAFPSAADAVAVFKAEQQAKQVAHTWGPRCTQYMYL